MIKYITLCICSLFYLSFLGCFDDKGNYDYKELNSPVWLDQNISVVGSQGGMIKIKGHKYFTWEKDSAEREANVRYEWSLLGKVISDKVDLEISVDSLIKMIPENPFSENGHWGKFSIIDETGIPYETGMMIRLTSYYAAGDWLILSERGDHSKLSLIKRIWGNEPDYVLTEDLFKAMNGFDIPGKPIGLVKSLAPYVGPLGATTIMTDKVSYVMNNLDMRKVSELKDEFLGGTPENFNVVDRREFESASGRSRANYTYLATKDGRVFRREMSENYVGGMFLSEPYVVDSKGYRVVKFGQVLVGNTNMPCYDEKNRRILMAAFETKMIIDMVHMIFESYVVHTFNPLGKGSAGDNIPPVWEMPEGTQVLYLAGASYLANTDQLYTILYNDKSGHTYIGDFQTSRIGDACLANDKLKVKRFPGGDLTSESFILTSVMSYNSANKILLYSKDKEIRYLDRGVDDEDNPFLTFDAKVTYMGYATYGYDFKKLWVGLEDGSVFGYDITNRRDPILLKKFKLDGKIVTMKELCNVYNGDAY